MGFMRVLTVYRLFISPFTYESIAPLAIYTAARIYLPTSFLAYHNHAGLITMCTHVLKKLPLASPSKDASFIVSASPDAGAIAKDDPPMPVQPPVPASAGSLHSSDNATNTDARSTPCHTQHAQLHVAFTFTAHAGTHTLSAKAVPMSHMAPSILARSVTSRTSHRSRY